MISIVAQLPDSLHLTSPDLFMSLIYAPPPSISIPVIHTAEPVYPSPYANLPSPPQPGPPPWINHTQAPQPEPKPRDYGYDRGIGDLRTPTARGNILVVDNAFDLRALRREVDKECCSDGLTPSNRMTRIEGLVERDSQLTSHTKETILELLPLYFRYGMTNFYIYMFWLVGIVCLLIGLPMVVAGFVIAEGPKIEDIGGGFAGVGGFMLLAIAACRGYQY
jgi:hypothetical protein